MHFIDLHVQQSSLKHGIESRIAAVLAHGQYIMGPEVAEVEALLAQYVGVRHCVTVASGTEGLLIALMGLGIGPGDEVITSPFTFVASAEAIVLAGAKPIFVDVDPLTCNIDPALIEAQITPSTKAIMPVSLYGQPADMHEINQIAGRHGLTVIEDAAQSFGATYEGRQSCGLSSIGVTSFFPSKPLGCYGDGGAIFTDDDGLARAFREIRVHGQSARYVHTRIGVGGRMDTLQCAILLAKWPAFQWEVASRARIGLTYAEALMAQVSGASVLDRCEVGHPLNGLRVLPLAGNRTSVHAQYTVLVNERDRLITHLTEAGIPTAVHYPTPINQQLAYRDTLTMRQTPVSSWLASHVLSLPMGPYMEDHQIEQVVRAIAEAQL